MKVSDIAIILLVLLAGFFIIKYSGKQKTIVMNPVQVIPIEHASGVLTWDGKNIYMDPVGDAILFEGKPTPDIILITDIHGDHFSAPTLQAVSQEAIIIAPQAVLDQMPEDLASRTKVLANGETVQEDGFQITAVPMYNLPTAENASFHTQGRGNGYIIEKDGFRVYIAGDTAGTPEMRALRNINIAFVPMNLPYTMNVDEAADAVLEFKPKIVYPYHYRGPEGLSDVNRFKELVNSADSSIEVILLDWYPAE